MYTRTIYLPSNAQYTIRDADAYIRSAFTIPVRATVTDTTASTGVLIATYHYKQEMIAQFTCYPMSSKKG